ncbi:right-handed parallel beta-helix repeat-containing protein [bacterium]|nr:right-handed parallel beta-helix repeat-containing protein [bacterium]
MLFLTVSLFCGAFAETVLVEGDLQEAINLAVDGDTLILPAGRYVARAATFVEATCGNCAEHQTRVQATRGFVIDAKGLVLRGRSAEKTVLVTQAGYGLLLLNSQGSVIENLTITGGKRDPDGAATDAGIVLKNSRAVIRRCLIADNTDYIDSTIVGIGGIMLREGSDARIEQCTIVNNSWDGIALYRGAQAVISDCVIDSGRGAGIGVTWDAAAICLRNRVSNYWKGIGSFGTATVIARNNAVCDNLGWGIITSGQSTMIAENNVSARNGNCGMAVWNAGTRGRMVNNISAFNGWRKEWVCPCVGFWNQEGDTAGWTVSHNIVWDNAAGDVLGQDSTRFLFTDPLFSDTLSFRLDKSSPALNAGDPAISNRDGTRSHIGLTGGPSAKR